MGQELPAVLGPDRLRLVEECLALGESQMMRLVEPADIDAVMDMYIKRGPCPAARA